MADHGRGMSGERQRHPGIGRAEFFVKPVAVDDCERPAISIVAVLRQVREALDPGYATRRVRIGALPLVPR
jgi:hypothetical protein